MSTVPRIQVGPRGSALALQPTLDEAFWTLYGALWSRGVLDHRAKEVARLRNARTVDCRLCRNVRFAGAREEGLTEDQVDHIRDGYEQSPLDPRDVTVLRFTDAFLHAPAHVPAELQTALRAHFTEPQIVELTLGLALFHALSKLLITIGLEPETMPTTVVPTPTGPTR